MRIRKSASRLLGSAYSAPGAPPPDAATPLELPTPPPPHLAPCSAPFESRGGAGFSSPVAASGDPCELNRSPWDLIAELSLSDPQVEDDLVDRYFVHVACRASWLFSADMPATSGKKKKEKLAGAAAGEDRAQPRREVAKKVPKKVAVNKEEKESEAKKKAKVKKEEGEGGAAVWKCKKNDGKRWHCHRTVRRPNSLCDYHLGQKRSYLNPESELASAAESAAVPVSAAVAFKRSASSKPRKKKSGDDFNATEGFYYYTGFGPFRSKRQCRSSGMNEPVPAKQEEEELPQDASPPNQADAAEDTNLAAAHDDVSSCDDIARIAGGDEESSDDNGLGGGDINVNGEHRVGNGDSKRKNIPWKRWRKPVKARSLKSLM